MAAVASPWGEQCVHTLTLPSALLSTHRALKAYLGGTLVTDWAHRVIGGAKLTPYAALQQQLDGQLGPISATEYPRSVGGVDTQRASALFAFN